MQLPTYAYLWWFVNTQCIQPDVMPVSCSGNIIGREIFFSLNKSITLKSWTELPINSADTEDILYNNQL